MAISNTPHGRVKWTKVDIFVIGAKIEAYCMLENQSGAALESVPHTINPNQFCVSVYDAS